MTTLTTLEMVQQLAEQSSMQLFCTHCGEEVTKTGSPCTISRCQYYGIEELLSVELRCEQARLSFPLAVTPLLSLEVVLELAINALEQLGVDTEPFELHQILQWGTRRFDVNEMLETPIELCLCGDDSCNGR